MILKVSIGSLNPISKLIFKSCLIMVLLEGNLKIRLIFNHMVTVTKTYKPDINDINYSNLLLVGSKNTIMKLNFKNHL